MHSGGAEQSMLSMLSKGGMQCSTSLAHRGSRHGCLLASPTHLNRPEAVHTARLNHIELGRVVQGGILPQDVLPRLQAGRQVAVAGDSAGGRGSGQGAHSWLGRT